MEDFPDIVWGDSDDQLIEWLASPEVHEVATHTLLWHVGSPPSADTAARNVLSALRHHVTTHPNQKETA